MRLSVPTVFRLGHDLHVARRVTRTLGSLCLIACFTVADGAVAADSSSPIVAAPITGPRAFEEPMKAGSVDALQRDLLSRKPDVDVFRARGPFGVAIHEDRELRLPTGERIRTDIYLSAPSTKAPLLVFLHGDDSSKRAHAKQAEHLASWGMHSLSVQLPNKGPWDINGRTLTRLVRLVQRAPETIDKRVDASRIILVGHSFGAFAVAVALADGAPVAGAIALDPAGAGKDLPPVLRRIQKPVMVLGADDDEDTPRNRDHYYEYIRTGVAEVSIRNATHEDAQWPSDFALQNGGVDPDTTEALQISFASAIAATAVSISATGTLEYAWASFQAALQSGRLFNAKRK